MLEIGVIARSPYSTHSCTAPSVSGGGAWASVIFLIGCILPSCWGFFWLDVSCLAAGELFWLVTSVGRGWFPRGAEYYILYLKIFNASNLVNFYEDAMRWMFSYCKIECNLYKLNIIKNS